MAIIDQYPALRKAFIEMSYDNGGINRWRTEEAAVDDSDQVALRWEGTQLERFEAWVSVLTDDEVRMLVAGESREIAAMIEGSTLSVSDKIDMDSFLNSLFEVC